MIKYIHALANGIISAFVFYFTGAPSWAVMMGAWIVADVVFYYEKAEENKVSLTNQ